MSVHSSFNIYHLTIAKSFGSIKIRDFGAGVPAEDLPKLFQPFFRVGFARERGAGGFGLGLAITERAMRAHGGTVTAENAPDGGLVVCLKLKTEIEK